MSSTRVTGAGAVMTSPKADLRSKYSLNCGTQSGITKSESPHDNIECTPQVINGVKCVSFTTSDEKTRKRLACLDRSRKIASRKLKFQHESQKVTSNGNTNFIGSTGRHGGDRVSCILHITETAHDRAKRIARSLQWDVVRVLREADTANGQDIVLVRPTNASSAPLLSALRDQNGQVTVLTESNKCALLQIEDFINSVVMTSHIRAVPSENMKDNNVLDRETSMSQQRTSFTFI